MEEPQYAKGYWNPYVAGVALGLVLLLCFYLTGSGLGASGAVARTAAVAAHVVSPEWVERNGYFQEFYKQAGRHPFINQVVFMVIGVFLGGLVAVITAKRFIPMVARGPNAGVGFRLSLAFVGGVIGGVGTRFAMGCTSGQALSGGATMALGSWVFMMAVFGAAFVTAYFVRRQWS